eukprot:325824-Amphidinium_carterae.1
MCSGRTLECKTLRSKDRAEARYCRDGLQTQHKEKVALTRLRSDAALLKKTAEEAGLPERLERGPESQAEEEARPQTPDRGKNLRTQQKRLVALRAPEKKVRRTLKASVYTSVMYKAREGRKA